MKILKRIANFIDPTHKNAVGDNLARDFWRTGNRGLMPATWSQVLMTEQDKYTGYMYGAIDRRAKKVAWLGTYNLMTNATPALTDAAKKKDEAPKHPYLEMIDKSPTFDNYFFWYAVQTFIDLKGVYYLLAVRNFEGARVGAVQEFKLLNPYEITKVRNLQDLNEVVGYVETRDGMYRELPPEMIIEVRSLNPFSRDVPFAMADAAKDSQFTLKQGGEQLRQTQARNTKFPGIAALGDQEVAMDTNQVANFKARLLGQRKAGEPIITDAKGAVNWTDMQIDLRKSMPTDAKEIGLTELIAVTGTSKTKFNIEQSGVTRDSASVQDDLYIADQAMPALQFIIGALNQDYKTHYAEEYKRTGYELYIDSPLGVDREAELKDVEKRKQESELAEGLVAKGYTRDQAAKYATGKLSLEDLGEPKNPPKSVKTPGPIQDKVLPAADKSALDRCTCPDPMPGNHVHNNLDDEGDRMVAEQQSSLMNSVVNVEQRVVGSVLGKLTINDVTGEDLLSAEDRQAYERELELVLVTFYTTILPLYAQSVLRDRAKEFSLPGMFTIDAEVRRYIKLTATRAAGGHIQTVLDDLADTYNRTYEDYLQDEVRRLQPTMPGRTPESILADVRKLGMTGVPQERIARALRVEFSQSISKNRAQTIAVTETHRAFNRSQYEADRQFLGQNNLTERAYKKWETRSGNPCPYCRAKEGEPPIPFTEPFARLDDVLESVYDKKDGTKSVRKMVVGFEDVQSGNLHPNCQCRYRLVII